MNEVGKICAGLGKYLKLLRERDGLSRIQLAEALAVSPQNLKRFEHDNYEEDWGNGFSIILLVKLADYSSSDVISVLKKIDELSEVDNQEEKSLDLTNLPISTKDRRSLYDASYKESEIFGNHLEWALKIAAMTSRISDESKADLEMLLLQQTKKNPKVKSRLKDLIEFKYT